MDQAASTLCTAGHALFFDCRSRRGRAGSTRRSQRWLEILVLDTKTPHALVDSEYAARRASCEEAARLLGVAALRDVTDLDAALAALPDDVMRRRVRHVVTENARVQEAAELLRAGRVADLAPLLDASHASMRDDFEITVPHGRPGRRDGPRRRRARRPDDRWRLRWLHHRTGARRASRSGWERRSTGASRTRDTARPNTSRPFRPRGPTACGEPQKSFRSGSEADRHRSISGTRGRIHSVVRTIRRTRAVQREISPGVRRSLGLEGAAPVNVRIKLGCGCGVGAALVLSACGSSSLSGEPAARRPPRSRSARTRTLPASCPESIKSAGVIKIGTDASYAPNEFLAGDGKTVQGMDVDVFNAVAAKFGVKTEWQPADFGVDHQRRQRQEVRHRASRRSPSTTSARSRSTW